MQIHQLELKCYQTRGVKIDKSFLSQLFQMLLKKRIPLFDTVTNSYRLIHGENDFYLV